MKKLPPPPHDIPASVDLTLLAPQFTGKVFELITAMRLAGHDPLVAEAFRSDERQAYLFGFGRQYDDDRGIVTNAATGRASWHRYGMAVDIISRRHKWDPPLQFWHSLRGLATDLGLTSGADWNRNGIPAGLDPAEHLKDAPHVQWFTVGMPVSPTDADWDLLMTDGPKAIWRKYHADWMPPAEAK